MKANGKGKDQATTDDLDDVPVIEIETSASDSPIGSKWGREEVADPIPSKKPKGGIPVPRRPVRVQPKKTGAKVAKVSVLYVAVSASHVTLSCDCGKISVVYSSIDRINATQLSSPILSCNKVYYRFYLASIYWKSHSWIHCNFFFCDHICCTNFALTAQRSRSNPTLSTHCPPQPFM